MTAGPGRTLGLPSLVSLVIASMIGAGAFTTSGSALADLGSARREMAAWVVGGVLAFCGALGYGSLARHVTESGGEHLFLSRLGHPAAGFVAGWVSLLAASRPRPRWPPRAAARVHDGRCNAPGELAPA